LTEQRHAHVMLESSERKYRAIFESAGFATWESDWSETMRIASDGKSADLSLGQWLREHPETVTKAVAAAIIRTANPAAIRLFEAESPAELVGANLCGRYLPEGSDRLATILIQLAAGAPVAESEVRLRTLGNRVIDIVLRVALVPEGSAWTHVIVTAFDVTDRNETRARFEQVSAELAHAARVSMLGQLSASITHEVNQPLTAIINYGKSAKRWLRQDNPDLQEISQCVERMIANGTRAASVVERVRKLARKTAVHAEAVDIVELVEDTISLVQREARASDVNVRFKRTPGLPPILADRVQVQQVLMNLVMNGIQAMRDAEANERELKIEVTADPQGAVKVAVTDSGTGFAADEQARLFEPFYTTKPDGMGMGLSICRSIIESQGGQISARNNETAGATISFILPIDTRLIAKPPELIS
jgi:signal transduction histidine kinase